MEGFLIAARFVHFTAAILLTGVFAFERFVADPAIRQFGAEAIIPANRFTGHGYGGVFQLHFYLDDLLPRSIGRPISEWW